MEYLRPLDAQSSFAWSVENLPCSKVQTELPISSLRPGEGEHRSRVSAGWMSRDYVDFKVKTKNIWGKPEAVVSFLFFSQFRLVPFLPTGERWNTLSNADREKLLEMNWMTVLRAAS
jgi:hypothetical protein